MTTIRESLDQLIDVIGKSEVLSRYQNAKQELQRNPEKERRVQEFRVKNYNLQNKTDNTDILTEMKLLKKEYGDVYSDPIVQEFLNAEVAVCKILQIINREVMKVIDFEDLLIEDEK